MIVRIWGGECVSCRAEEGGKGEWTSLLCPLAVDGIESESLTRFAVAP